MHNHECRQCGTLSETDILQPSCGTRAGQSVTHSWGLCQKCERELDQIVDEAAVAIGHTYDEPNWNLITGRIRSRYILVGNNTKTKGANSMHFEMQSSGDRYVALIVNAGMALSIIGPYPTLRDLYIGAELEMRNLRKRRW